MVDNGDTDLFVTQFGRTAGGGLTADFDGDGRVDLVDFAILRDNMGNTLPGAPAAAAEAPAAAVQTSVEPIAPAAAPAVPVASQAPDDGDVDDGFIAAAASAPDIDLLVVSPSSAGYIPGPQAISADLPATARQLAATAEYDLRPLRDDSATDGQTDDLLVDVLEDSYYSANSARDK